MQCLQWCCHIVRACARACLFSPLDVFGLTCPQGWIKPVKVLLVCVCVCVMFWDVLGLSMDMLTVCFKPACGAYAFCMRVLCFMCQTHLFAQMLSESTNTRRTFCLCSVHPHARLLQAHTHTSSIHKMCTCSLTHFEHSVRLPGNSFPKSDFQSTCTYMYFLRNESEDSKYSH